MLVGAAVALACAASRPAAPQPPPGLPAHHRLLGDASRRSPDCRSCSAPRGLDFTDAYFEFTSALTTTGSTVIVGIDDLPRGALLWRCMVTWVGGIGIILLAMILLPVLNIGGMQMLKSADFNTLGKIMPQAKSIAVSIGFVYLVLTLACTLGLPLGGDARLRRHLARLLHHRHRRHGQPRQLLRRLLPGGAVGRHRLHAARRHVLQPLRPARPRRAAGALPRQPDPRLPRHLPRPRRGLLAARLLADAPLGARHPARGALQPRLGHHHHRLRRHRLLALGPLRRDDLLLRHDDLRLLRLHLRRAQGLPLPAPPRRRARRGPPPAQPERRLHPALPGRRRLRPT